MCLWVCTMYLALEYDIKYFLNLNLLCASSIQMSPQLPNDIKLLNLSQNSIELEPYSMRPFPSGFFHLALCLQDFFFHLVVGVRCSPMSFLCLGEPLLLIAQYYSTKWMKCSSFPRFLGGHLACPQFYTITSKAAINIHMQVFWVAISFQLSWVNTEEHD